MKTTSKLQFGFNAVAAGQRKASYVPELVALTTAGGFRITPPISKALNIQHGEYVQFIQNVDQVQRAIDTKDSAYVEFCQVNGLDVDAPESGVAFHKEYDLWGIVKGYPLYNSNGTEQTATERLSKADKEAYAAKNYDELLAAAMESGTDEMKDAIAAAGDDKEAIVRILAVAVRGEEHTKFSGSKTANASGMIGSGVVLNFTDSNVWNQLKGDLGEDASKKARKFAINVEDMMVVELFDGCKTVEVPCLPFDVNNYEDVDAARFGAGE